MRFLANRLSSLKNPLLNTATLTAYLATSPEDIRDCLRLRYEIFAREMGACIHNEYPDIDYDHFDDYARHLMVVDSKTHELVATTRLIDNKASRQAGGFYSETEFDIKSILEMDINTLEIGRTCIAESHRNGTALSVLWQAIARITSHEDIDFLIGCASIPVENSFSYAHSIMQYIREHHTNELTRAIRPRHALPEDDGAPVTDVILPTLIKGYTRLGAALSAEACYDEDFKVADVFTMLDSNNVARRYAKHFN